MYPPNFIFHLCLLPFTVSGYIGKKSHQSTQQGLLNNTNKWSLRKTPPKPSTFMLVCCTESQTQAASSACSCTTFSTGCTLIIFQQHSRHSSVWEFIGTAHQAQPCMQSNHKLQGQWTLCSASISTKSVPGWITIVPGSETGPKSDLG